MPHRAPQRPRPPSTHLTAFPAVPLSRPGYLPAAAVRNAEHYIATRCTRPCLAAAYHRRPSLRRWLTHERRQRRSAPPTAARHVLISRRLHRACAARVC
eukprot:scaffold108272_cov36-Phaeocystis_antarctica.AAC.1